MKHWKHVLAFAGAFAIGCSLLAWAGQVPNPINAQNTIVSGHFILGYAPQNAQDSGWSLVPMANGGCNAALTATNNDLLYSTASACALLATANNSILATNGSGAPAWTTTLPGGITIPAGDLPLPTPTTLGGLESQTCPAHQWLDIIPTTQVQPSCAQPAITDISGIAATAPIAYSSGTWSINLDSNFAAIGGNLGFANCNAGYVHGNSTASAAEPTCASLTSMFDQAYCATQGGVLYRGPSTWGCLATGASGRMLQTQGASANPQWVSTKAPIMWAGTGAQSANTTRYYYCSGPGGASSGTNGEEIFPYSGTLVSLYIAENTAPGTGNTVQATVYVNSTATGITCTVSNSATTCSDTAHTASVSAGQNCYVAVAFSTSAASSTVVGAMELDTP